MPVLIKEASLCFPHFIEDLDGWIPPWEADNDVDDSEVTSVEEEVLSVELTETEVSARELLFKAPATTDALAGAFGAELVWRQELSVSSDEQLVKAPELSPKESAARNLLFSYQSTTDALSECLGTKSTGVWTEVLEFLEPPPQKKSASSGPVTELLKAYPQTLEALAIL